MLAAILYGLTTPIGIAAGLGVRTTYNPNSNTANIVSGVLDSFSSGILLYTGLVEVRDSPSSEPPFALSNQRFAFRSSWHTSSCSTRTCCKPRTGSWRTRCAAWSSALGSWRYSAAGRELHAPAARLREARYALATIMMPKSTVLVPRFRFEFASFPLDTHPP